MKKTFLSLIVAGALFGGATNLMASDTTALTKATVKLIKSYSDLEAQVNGISDHSNLNYDQLNQAKSSISKLESNLNSTNDQLSKTNYKVLTNEKNIQSLNNTLSKIESKADNAVDISNETKNLVLEMRGLSKDFKDQSGQVVSSAQTAYAKANIAETKTKAMEEAIRNDSAETKNNSLRVKDLEQKLNTLSMNFEQYTSTNNKEKEELRSQLASQKIQFESEIKILKAKFDRARPVYVMNKQEPVSDCSNGNCKGNKEVDDVITNFIK